MSVAISAGKYSTESAYIDVSALSKFKKLIIDAQKQIKSIQ